MTPIAYVSKAFALCLAICLFAEPARATNYIVRAHAQQDQTTEYEKGFPTTFSSLDSSDVALSFGGMQHNRRLVFAFDIENTGETSVDVDLSDVTAVADGVPLHVYDRDELVKKEKSRAFWGSMAVAALEGAQMGLNNRPTTVTSYGHYGRTSYSSTTQIYNSAADNYADAQIADRSERMYDNIRSVRNGNIEDIDNGIIQLTTVKSGDVFGGIIVVEPPEKNKETKNITVTVKFGDDVHTFVYDMVPKKE